MRRRRVISAFLLLAVVISTAGALLVAPARHARAAVTEHIASYDVILTPKANGELAVRETVVYDFGSDKRHGIFRQIATRESYDKTQNRIWELDDVRVTQDGKTAEVKIETENGVKAIQIGDGNNTVTGTHTYVIDYRVGGAFLGGPDGVDLTWDAIGAYWDVPIAKASVSLTGSLAGTPVSCVMGDTSSTEPCATDGSSFTATDLAAKHGVTTHYRLSAGSIIDLGPILRHKVTPAWFFTGKMVGLGAGLLAALVGAGAVVLRWRRHGRDESFAGQIPGLAPAPGQSSAVRVGGPESVTPVAFTPPAGVRPAELAMLMNERSDQRGVTATLIDLAVRGHLRIEEVEGDRSGKPDHVLTRLERSTSDQVADYEQDLLDGVFDTDPQVLLSEKKNDFAAVSSATQKVIERRAVGAGWFAREPSRTRMHWSLLGIALVVAGIIAMAAGGQWGWGAPGAGVIVIGLTSLVLAGSMPARTALGSAVRADGLAFCRYLATAEADQIRSEEREESFNRYLPFAIAFDLADHWVSTFQNALATVGGNGSVVGNAIPHAGWYIGTGGFDNFNSGLSSFDSGMSSAMTSASSSGSSGAGMVGGGGGGGGGGSW